MSFATTHAWQRATQRLPFQPAEWDFEGVVLDIIARISGAPSQSWLLSRRASGVETWATRMRGHAVVVAYAPMDACIITVMPSERKK